MLAIYIISKWTADGFLGNVEKLFMSREDGKDRLTSD